MGRRWWWGMCLLLGACHERGPGPTGDGGNPDPPPPWRIERPNPIPAENALAGEPSWRSGRRSASGEVELYLSTVSALSTSQAYNGYGGESLYQDSSGTMPMGRAHEVSFDRPFAASDGLGKVWRWEAFLATFLERYGYDVTYSTNLDFARSSRLVE